MKSSVWSCNRSKDCLNTRSWTILRIIHVDFWWSVDYSCQNVVRISKQTVKICILKQCLSAPSDPLLQLEVNQSLIDSQASQSRKFFVCKNSLLGLTACSCWASKDAAVCSLSTAGCLTLVSLPKHVANPQCFTRERGHTQRESETELLVEKAIFGSCRGSFQISMILAWQRQEQ